MIFPRPRPGVTQLIGGYQTDTANTWTMFLNICGNAAITTPTTCKNPTPVCMVDGYQAYDCGGAGAQNLNWAVGPYYAPGKQGTLLEGGSFLNIALPRLNGDQTGRGCGGWWRGYLCAGHRHTYHNTVA
jgi:hypothetical protein